MVANALYSSCFYYFFAC